MQVLALAHGEYFGAGIFGDVVRDRGHDLVEWESSDGAPPDAACDALLVFGGRTHPDQEADNPWLADELDFLRGHVEAGTPILGVCLGAQLVARATGGRAYPLDEPERGWADVELTPAGREDPLFADWPDRVRAFESHAYTFEPPPGAVELARNAHRQAYRFGDSVWGVQFHPEVTAAHVEGFIERRSAELGDPEQVRAESAEQIGRWNQLGRALCGAFLSRA